MKKRYPFKFLNAYTLKDKDFFFGRDKEVAHLYDMAFQGNIILLYGGSGTGKTSLINCGLASKFESYDWLALTIRRRSHIIASLKESLQSAAGIQDEVTEEISTLSSWRKLFGAVYKASFRPIYLIFDQFEELFTLGNKQEQTDFVEVVKHLLQVEEPVKMIFVIREEYLGHLFDFEREVPELMSQKVRVEAMDLSKVKEVMRGIAAAENSNVQLQEGEEDKIGEAIFIKLRGEDRNQTIHLPYLQVFLDKLYVRVTGDKTREAEALFTLADVEAMGSIEDVLLEFLEEQVIPIQDSLKKEYPDFTGIADPVWRMLSHFVTLEGTKAPISYEALQEQLPNFPEEVVKEVLTHLESRRIIRHDEKHDLYEVAHDSLAKHIAARRTEDDIAILEINRMIKNQITLQGDARGLLTEKQLNFMEPFLEKISLNEEEWGLVRESQEVVREQQEIEREAAEAETKRLMERQELLERNRKKGKILSWVMAGASVLMAVALGVVLWQWEIAKEEKQKAGLLLFEVEKGEYIRKSESLVRFGDAYWNYGEKNAAQLRYCKAIRAGEKFKKQAKELNGIFHVNYDMEYYKNLINKLTEAGKYDSTICKDILKKN